MANVTYSRNLRIGEHHIVIRRWRESDRAALAHMVLHCLEINYDAGADMQATPKNALALVDLGYAASAKGEPCFVVDLRSGECPGPIGYTLWCSLPNPLGLDYRGNPLYGLGTYVMPPFQRAGISTALRDVAERDAKTQGFTKVVGTAFTVPGLQSVLSRGYVVTGQSVEKVFG